jgi:hypothetical protein
VLDTSYAFTLVTSQDRIDARTIVSSLRTP